MELTPAAERDLRSLDPHVRKLVVRDLLRLEKEPRPHGVQMLQAAEKLLRVHVGPGKNYLAIYRIADAALVVLIVKVGDRKDVYQRF